MATASTLYALKTPVSSLVLAATLSLLSFNSEAAPDANQTSEKKVAQPAKDQSKGTSKSTGKKFRFSFNKSDLNQIVAAYSKQTGQKFVVDGSFRGTATIMNNDAITSEEAFNLLSSSLMTNGYAISEQGDTMVIQNARNVQRNLIPVLTELPPLKPERMVTMVFNLKHQSAEELNKRIRMLPSKDGEMQPFDPGNKLIVTDWVSNLHRISKLITEIDIPSSDAKN